MKHRRIVCAAIRADDGDILLGIRHYSRDMIVQIDQRSDGEKFKNRSGDDQGFVDHKGEYLTRKQAFIVAKQAGQIIYPDACRGETLYSEGLY